MKQTALIEVETCYWLPYCSTCVKAQQFLLDHGVRIRQYVNTKEEAVSKTTLETLAESLGGVVHLFSKRAMKYRSLGLHEKTLTDEEMLSHMLTEYTFIKRPVMVFSSGEVLAGFSKKQYEVLLK
ncbi:MAG: ArsC/Spx/MgsR family protein [Cyanobacteria bacterium P01_H01_bin.74]